MRLNSFLDDTYCSWHLLLFFSVNCNRPLSFMETLTVNIKSLKIQFSYREIYCKNFQLFFFYLNPKTQSF